VYDGNAVSTHQFRWPHTGELQQLRGIDRAAGEQYLAPRSYPVHHSVLLGFELVDVAVEAGRDVDQRVAVFAARFEQQYLRCRVGAQPVREQPAEPAPTMI
jgi:hypothetical protein